MSSRARPAGADDADSRKMIKLSEGRHPPSIADRDQPDHPGPSSSLLGLNYLPGTTPILWTAVPVSLVDNVFRERVAVITFYNPARFIQQLRSAGFEVGFLPDGSGLRLIYVQGELSIEIQNSDYFVRLIQDHLADESTVVQGMLNILQGLDPRQLRSGMTIDFVPVRAH